MAIRNVREHLSQHHQRSASFDLGVAGQLEQLRKTFESLEGQSDGDMRKSFAGAKEAFDKLGTSFNEHAAYHAKMKEACEKSDGVDDLDKLMPSNISGIVDPSRAPSSGRLVPRSGQPTPSDMPKVDMQFEHLI